MQSRARCAVACQDGRTVSRQFTNPGRPAVAAGHFHPLLRLIRPLASLNLGLQEPLRSQGFEVLSKLGRGVAGIV